MDLLEITEIIICPNCKINTKKIWRKVSFRDPNINPSKYYFKCQKCDKFTIVNDTKLQEYLDEIAFSI